VLHRIGQRFGRDEVRGGLDVGWEAVVSNVDGDGQRGPAGQLAQGRVEPVVEVGRAYAVGELAKLGDGNRQLLDGAVDGPGRRRVGPSNEGVEPFRADRTVPSPTGLSPLHFGRCRPRR